MIALTDSFKRYLVTEQMIKPGVLNLLANGLIAWLVFRQAERIAFWTHSAIAPDLVLTALLLPFIISMINSRVVFNKVVAGELARIASVDSDGQGWHLRSILFRSTFLGLVCVVLYAIPTVLVLPMVWDEPLRLWQFVLFKSVWAAILAIVVCPMVALWAVRSASAVELS